MSLKKQLVDTGSIFQTTSDTELILQLVARSKKQKLMDKLVDALNQIKGAYSLIILTNKKLIGITIFGLNRSHTSPKTGSRNALIRTEITIILA